MNLKCTIEKSYFGLTPTGNPVYEYTLKHKNGLLAKVINFGGILTELNVADRYGNHSNVVLGFQDVKSYLKENIYAGAIVGRIAGRLAKGKYRFKDKEYQLTQNEGETHLHGGAKGLDKRIWNAKIVMIDDCEVLELKYFSREGEEGYPGNLNIKVTYSLTDKKGIRIDYEAESDKLCPVCLTNHTYFNLLGEGVRNISNHRIQINSDAVIEVGENYLPTGKIKKVDAHYNDFRKPDFLTKMTKSTLDKNSHGALYILKNNGKDVIRVASVLEPESGRIMKVFTNTPYMQLYTGLFLNTKSLGRSGNTYGKFSGFCMECQGFSDAPNHEIFNPIWLLPGENFRQSTEYRFKVDPNVIN